MLWCYVIVPNITQIGIQLMHHREIQPKFHSSCDKMDDWDSLITGSSSINWCSVGHISCVLMPPPHDGLISAEMNTNQVFILKFIFNLKLLNLEKSRLFASYLGGLFPHFVQIFASKKVVIKWHPHLNCVIFGSRPNVQYLWYWRLNFISLNVIK